VQAGWLLRAGAADIKPANTSDHPNVAKDKRATLPSVYGEDFDIYLRFLDQYAGR
jgi:hypothetical protein